MRNYILFIVLLLFFNNLFSQNNAQFISQTGVPTTLNTGEQFTVSITMKNTGTTTWTVANDYRLGTANPYGNSTWSETRMYLSNDVAPGETYTFSTTLTAPSTAGIYTFQWSMVQESVEWFGEWTVPIDITVFGTGNQAAFISQNTPSYLDPNENFITEIKFKNVGTTTWTSYSVYNLGSQNPQDNTSWGTNRIALTNDIAPGDTAIFTTTLTAPSTIDTYNFQWEMVEDGHEWFGDSSKNIIIGVGIPYILNGTAISTGNDCYDITQGNVASESGSIWYAEKIDLTKPFDINFTINLDITKNNGADGVMFVLQTAGNDVLGDAGAFRLFRICSIVRN